MCNDEKVNEMVVETIKKIKGLKPGTYFTCRALWHQNNDDDSKKWDKNSPTEVGKKIKNESKNNKLYRSCDKADEGKDGMIIVEGNGCKQGKTPKNIREDGTSTDNTNWFFRKRS
jgi:hypothetical protein